MTECYDERQLRAYLDDALPTPEQLRLNTHLGNCSHCHARLDELREQMQQVHALLAEPITPPDAYGALTRFQQRHLWNTVGASAEAVPAPDTSWSTIMSTKTPFWNSPARRIIVAVVALVALVGVLMLPPVQTLADQLLQIFRVQQVVFVPISQERMDELENLNFDGNLFVSEPTVLNESEEVEVASAAEAAAAVGYPVREPSSLPVGITETEFRVYDDMLVEFQVDVVGVRSLLDLLNITDVEIPDALGEQPVQAAFEPMVGSSYANESYEVVVMQGRSPELSLPEGVDLRQMGTVLLRVLGMSPEQASEMANTIDWNSTLVVPFPQDISDVQQVQVNGKPALLMTGNNLSEGGSYTEDVQIYWQDGDTFFVLLVSSLDTEIIDALSIAESMY
ncbi:MAG: anti-sigma factor [Chloroflexaceae bacterium]|nr:anti-sigma factor [Chloroflexaceae bacterium]